MSRKKFEVEVRTTYILWHDSRDDAEKMVRSRLNPTMASDYGTPLITSLDVKVSEARMSHPERIAVAIEEAKDALWASVRAKFPEAMSWNLDLAAAGDIDEKLTEAVTIAIRRWVDMNVTIPTDIPER